MLEQHFCDAFKNHAEEKGIGLEGLNQDLSQITHNYHLRTVTRNLLRFMEALEKNLPAKGANA